MGLKMGAAIETRERIIDQLTGELLSDKTNVVNINKMPDEPAYIKFYIDDLSLLNKLTAGETRILLYVTSTANYQGEVLLPLAIKKRIAFNADLSIQAVSNAITKFCVKNILKRLDTGLYELNPELFARGKWREIRERRKAFYTKITYTPDGQRTVETDFVE
jgi:hypothetical protein